MLDEHNTSLPPPANWQDFEGLCLDLLGEIYGIGLVQKYWRQGQEQNGIDIIICPNTEHGWIGVQCKQKETYSERYLTESEVQREVAKATAFNHNFSVCYSDDSSVIGRSQDSPWRLPNVIFVRASFRSKFDLGMTLRNCSEKIPLF